jgi:hypothetical protein
MIIEGCVACYGFKTGLSSAVTRLSDLHLLSIPANEGRTAVVECGVCERLREGRVSGDGYNSTQPMHTELPAVGGCCVGLVWILSPMRIDL